MQHLEWNEAMPGRDRGRMHHFQAFSPPLHHQVSPSGEPDEQAWSKTLLRPNKSYSVITNAHVSNIYTTNKDLFLFMNITVSSRTVSGPFSTGLSDFWHIFACWGRFSGLVVPTTLLSRPQPLSSKILRCVCRIWPENRKEWRVKRHTVPERWRWKERVFFSKGSSAQL